jgi:hypothetical protein
VTVHAAGINQILFELVEPKTYALAVREIFDRRRRFGSGMFTFRNERAVWR